MRVAFSNNVYSGFIYTVYKAISSSKPGHHGADILDWGPTFKKKKVALFFNHTDQLVETASDVGDYN